MKMVALLPLLVGLIPAASAWNAHWKQHFGDIEQGCRGHQLLPGRGGLGSTSGATTGNGTFKQLIDHNNPALGTFDQFYFWSTEFWKGPGSPVVLFTPGEINITGYNSYLTINRTTGVMAQQVGGAVFALEHRYWGTSSPYDALTTENMKYLTLENSIKDLTYFANNVRVPWAPWVKSNAAEVPWVLAGGSYSGALSAWTESVAPGTFWAYHSSSAPVEAISDYWGYFLPVQEGMPKNCSKDLSAVIDYMDGILESGNVAAIHDLKARFKLETVEHNDDFMAALENGPWLWQGNQFYTGYSAFFQMCDYVENAVNATDGSVPGAEGVGVQKALNGYASWFSTVFLPDYCYDTYGYPDFNGTYNTACFNTYNASSPLFTDTTLSNTIDRQWNWMLCNEPFGYWQDGAPAGRPTIVSRLVTADYWIRQCALFFPPGPQGQTYGIAKGRTEADVNAYTAGWFIENSTRLIYANGGFDPWREASVSSELRPGGPLPSTAAVPINIVPGGFHTSDLITKNGQVNAGCKAVIDKEVAQIVEWVGQWPKRYGGGGYKVHQWRG